MFLLVVGFLVACGEGVFGVTRIHYENFEDQNFSDTFHAAQSDYWDHHAVVTNNPHGGLYSLRSNACSTCSDPITGLIGKSRTDLNFGWGGKKSSFRNFL